MRHPSCSFLALIATIALAGACGSGGTTAPIVGSITLAVTPTGATIQQGGSTQVTGTVARTNFTGDIAISVAGAPTGVSGAVTLAPVNGGSSAQVTLTAATSTLTGTYSLVIVAKGSGVDSATATFTLTIAAATPASYTMMIGTPSQSLAQGGVAPSALTFVRTAFTGNITLSAENLPAGVTATFSTNPVTGTTSSVTFNAATTAAPGTFNTILIRGTAAGLTDVTAAVTLTVTVTGSFSIAAGSGTLNVVQGSNVTSTLNATRAGGFAGTIVYTVTGPGNAALPVGLTAAVAPTATADQNTLTVTTIATLAPATYPIVIHATSFGSEQTATANVIVAFAGTVVRLDYSQCGVGGKPIWVAYQDGSAAFIRVTGTGDVYTFTIVSAKGAFAVVSQSGAVFNTTVQYFSQVETGTTVGVCAVPAAGKTINGTIAGLGASDAANVSMGGGSITVVPPGNPFQFVGVASGAQDMIAYRRNSATPGAVNDRIIIRRGLNVADGGSLALLDFTTLGGEVLLPTTSTITVTGATAGNTIIQNQGYQTGTACTLHSLYSKSGTTTSLFAYGVPVTNQLATDFYRLLVSEQVSANSSRSVGVSFHTLADRAIAMPAALSPTVTDITVAQNGFELLRSVLTLPTDYQSASFSYVEVTGQAIKGAGLLSAAGAGRSYTIIQSIGYIGGAGTVTMAATDLSTVSGYLAAWAPPKFNSLSYFTNATGTSGGATCTEGSTTKAATASGQTSS